MRKSYLITLTGSQELDGDKNTTELLTDGVYYPSKDGYIIEYEEVSSFGGDKVVTTLEIDALRKSVTMNRQDSSDNNLVFEKGKRHLCCYGPTAENLTVGICTHSFESSLDKDGGTVEFEYTIDINASVRSFNNMQIKVKEAAEFHGYDARS